MDVIILLVEFTGGFSLPGGSASAALGPAALRLSGQPCSSGAVLLVSNLNEEVYSNSTDSMDLFHHFLSFPKRLGVAVPFSLFAYFIV